jgi:hypothetical protein
MLNLNRTKEMIEKLKIIPADRVISFESYSEDRAAKLALDIEQDGKLKNPLLVYPLKKNYLLLDDASILAALKTLGVVHVPIQLAGADILSVHPWQRIVEEWRPEDLLNFCSKFPRQIRIEKGPTDQLAANQVEVRFRDDTVFRLRFRSRSYLIRVDMCAKFFDYLSRYRKSYRAKLNYDDSAIFNEFSGASAVVFPPSFSLAELAGIALRNIHLPQGLVRIDQPNRVLGIDYSLSILSQSAPADEKELFLRQLLMMRMSSDRVAYYDGGIFMFNN